MPEAPSSLSGAVAGACGPAFFVSVILQEHAAVLQYIFREQRLVKVEDMNNRLKKIPRIYEKLYEDGIYPTEKEIELIERNY